MTVAPPPSYTASLNLPTPAQSTTSLNQQDDNSGLPSYEDAVKT